MSNEIYTKLNNAYESVKSYFVRSESRRLDDDDCAVDEETAPAVYDLRYSSLKKMSLPGLRRTNPPVLFASTVSVLLFLCTVVFARTSLERVLPQVLKFVVQNFGWLYVSVTFLLFVALIYLALSEFGDIRLGNGVPEYSLFTWVAMMFSAGVGISLVYYGCAQPLDYYTNPPIDGISQRTAYDQAVPLTLFVQGYLSWNYFSFLGLALAYSYHVLKRPLSIRSVAAPTLGRYVHRWPGHIIDVVAVLATVFGIASSIGVGATQLMSGVNYAIPSIPSALPSQIVILGVVGFFSGLSVLCGLSKGLAAMANINIVLAFVLLMCFFFIRPVTSGYDLQWFPISHIESMIQNIGGFAEVLFDRALRTASDDPHEKGWMNHWGFFFSGWQLTWSPFVGTFLAKISRGRSIRTYIIGTILIPKLVLFL
eukprot:GHVH01009747.1.p1 GENE.GHVH01009747.1~~GHVH01009747.1.p1  ORF type:complete len:424 (+),score=23.22 GHVH01009747.1:125-1396(+)